MRPATPSEPTDVQRPEQPGSGVERVSTKPSPAAFTNLDTSGSDESHVKSWSTTNGSPSALQAFGSDKGDATKDWRRPMANSYFSSGSTSTLAMLQRGFSPL